jgi:hypothetical protein
MSPLLAQSGHCRAPTRPLPTRQFDPLPCHSPGSGRGNETARIYLLCRQQRRGLAAPRTRSAGVGNAADRGTHGYPCAGHRVEGGTCWVSRGNGHGMSITPQSEPNILMWPRYREPTMSKTSRAAKFSPTASPAGSLSAPNQILPDRDQRPASGCQSPIARSSELRRRSCTCPKVQSGSIF